MSLPSPRPRAVALCLAALLAAGARAAPPPASALDAAFAAYWQADGERGRRKAAKDILATGASFEEIHARLAAGRPYEEDAPTGRREGLRRSPDGTTLPYFYLVPEEYDPAQPYPLVFYLHGGVNRPAWRPGDEWWREWREVHRRNRISAFPASWLGAPWWSRAQEENLAAILEEIRASYNVDENRVFLVGVSDGATGAVYHALRDPTPWAAHLVFIGHPAVLGNEGMGVEGQMHAANAAGQGFFFINGGRDPLYPVPSVLPYLDLFQRAGADILFHPQPAAGHDVSWWPAEGRAIDAYLDSRRRDPLPDRLVWETEDVRRHGRRSWLVIEKLGDTRGQNDLDDLNTVQPLPPAPALGLRLDESGVTLAEVAEGTPAAAAGLAAGDRLVAVDGREVGDAAAVVEALGGFGYGSSIPMTVLRGGERRELTVKMPPPPPPAPPQRAFPRFDPSGRVELERRGNEVVAQTEGVERFTLLLSPAELDFSRPVKVVVNGEVVFEDRVEPSAETLLSWAARDGDRAMLFAAEVTIAVP